MKDQPEKDEGYSCEEEVPRDECKKSKKSCGHHRNHSWTHNGCCWCDAEFGESP